MVRIMFGYVLRVCHEVKMSDSDAQDQSLRRQDHKLPMDKVIIYSKVVPVIFQVLALQLHGAISGLIHRYTYKQIESPKNVVVVGAAGAGYHAAKLLANTLPTGYRVVIVEKNSHFNFTWVLPRFSVVSGHEHKAFIPYGPYLKGAPEGSYQWLQDRVGNVDAKNVYLQSGEIIPFEYLVIATGSNAVAPSRIGATDKDDGIEILQGLQTRIRAAEDVVVLGAGPAGVELAADAKELYPNKNVTLVHSRDEVLHYFGPGLRAAALSGLQKLGVRVILNERLDPSAAESDGKLTLKSGEELACDCLIKCTGQKAASDILSDLSPSSISRTGEIKVRKTLQIADEKFSNIFAAGDVIESIRNKNSRTAMMQAHMVAENVLHAIKSQSLSEYTAQWWEAGIDLTLGLRDGIMYLHDDKREALSYHTFKDIALKSRDAWRIMGATPYEDNANPIYKKVHASSDIDQ
ncbi:putative mercuric reductase [Phaeomoniella chlamydospora]|uniref:Putative mercuric reductase n=1 Tax=Phaeomoniella chlamydospora TaxID=158046 RepID=A0A0G2EU36_PHACM|nr:putative mercuric reductase [Phaeomoniella chlamydospora]